MLNTTLSAPAAPLTSPFTGKRVNFILSENPTLIWLPWQNRHTDP